MTLIIIVLAVCLILGSALWILPSPKEKRQMLLRRHAMSKGIQVQLSQLKDPQNPLDKIHCAAYRLALAPDKNKSRGWLLYQPELSYRSDVNGWGFEIRPPVPDKNLLNQLSSLVEQLPAGILAIEQTPVSVAVYWRERGEISDVDRIYETLVGLQSL